MATPRKIWSKFTKNRDGKELKLRIEEMPKENFEEIFGFLFKYFVPEEPLHKVSKVSQRTEALEEYQQAFTALSEETNYQIDVCCLDQDADNPEILGISIMVLEKRDKLSDDFASVIAMVQSQEIKTLLTISTVLDERCKIFEKFDVDSCYKGRGVAVHKDYRGLGIAGELLRARSTICKERGVPMTSAWMTSVGTQKAAAKLGWETISEVQYTDLGREMGVEFEPEPVSCILMFDRVQ